MKHKLSPSLCCLLIGAVLLSLSACSRTEESPPTEHLHAYTVKVADPTCIESGHTLYTCDCGHSYIEDGAVSLGHCYETPTIVATENAPGYFLSVCSRCGYLCQDSFAQYHKAISNYLLPFDTFARERVHAPEFVMIHFISAVVLSEQDPYNTDTIRSIFKDNELSVHYIIDRDGTIRCYIPEDLVAYHAGKGQWNNDPSYTNSLNDYAIGIELVAIGSQSDMKQYLSSDVYHRLDPKLIGFTDAQYDALEDLVADICQRNNIPMDRQHVIGHQEYAPQKTDPGELFDWDRLIP